jgi:antitoxin ParD1/3/4
MLRMNVTLTPQLKSLIRAKVENGMYDSPSEVVREGLRLLLERDETRRAQLKRLQREVAVGLDELRRGESVDGPAAFAALRRKNAVARRRRNRR